MSEIPSKLSSDLSTGRLAVALWQNACPKILMRSRTLRYLIYQLNVVKIQKQEISNKISITTIIENLTNHEPKIILISSHYKKKKLVKFLTHMGLSFQT